MKIDTIIADIDSIVADATAARCIDFHPNTLGRVRCLYEAGKVKITNVEIVADGIDAVYQKWELD